MRTSVLFTAYNFGFLKLWCVHTDKKGIEPERTICGRRGGESNYRDFVRTSLMDSP